MAALTVQDATDGLADVTFTAATSGGDTVVGGVQAGGWSLPALLLVNNGAGESVDVTVDGMDDDISVSNGDIAAIPLRGGGKSGTVLDVSYSETSGVTHAAVRLWEQ